jgi:hypothetical protein
VPDPKTRLAGVILDLAYREGSPVKRQVVATARFEDLGELQHASGTRRKYERITSQKTVKGHDHAVLARASL